jgi:hypothetical protein
MDEYSTVHTYVLYPNLLVRICAHSTFYSTTGPVQQYYVELRDRPWLRCFSFRTTGSSLVALFFFSFVAKTSTFQPSAIGTLTSSPQHSYRTILPFSPPGSSSLQNGLRFLVILLFVRKKKFRPLTTWLTTTEVSGPVIHSLVGKLLYF